MAYLSRTYYTASGTNTDFTVTFPYLDKSHVTVYLNGVLTTSWSWLTASTIRMATPPASGVTVLIRRNTSQGARLVDYVSPSSLNEDDLDTDSLQAFYLGQEAIDAGSATISDDPSTGQYTAGNKRLTNVADPVNAQDAATKNFVLTGLGSGVAAAAASATAAAGSASSASTSAGAASTSATTATTKATEAAASAVAAAASATTATTKASEAAASASSASTSSATASTKASDAAASASAAAGSASAAATSATAAGTSATNAAASAAAAAASALAAAANSTVQDQISAATTSTFADTDHLPARQSSSGNLIKRTWANVKSDIRVYLGAAVSASGAKSSPVDADQLLLSDSASSDATAKLSWLNLLTGVWNRFGGLIAGGTAKTTPVGADMVPLADSAASNGSAKSTLSNLWLNYFKPLADALYAGVSHTHTFASLTSKPTTLSDYGISDAQASSSKLSAIAALADAAGVLQNNGAGALSWASVSSGGMTLLGTITTSSGSTQSLTGLSLSGYKQLVCVINKVKVNIGSGSISQNNQQLSGNGTSSANQMVGILTIDLATGVASIVAGFAPSGGSFSGGTQIGYDAGITTASTSISFVAANTFTGGNIRVYGVA